MEGPRWVERCRKRTGHFRPLPESDLGSVVEAQRWLGTASNQLIRSQQRVGLKCGTALTL
jgi:hypothetical protein